MARIAESRGFIFCPSLYGFPEYRVRVTRPGLFPPLRDRYRSDFLEVRPVPTGLLPVPVIIPWVGGNRDDTGTISHGAPAPPVGAQAPRTRPGLAWLLPLSRSTRSSTLIDALDVVRAFEHPEDAGPGAPTRRPFRRSSPRWPSAATRACGGAAHLCGHDLHTAIRVGMAQVLAQLSHRRTGSDPDTWRRQ